MSAPGVVIAGGGLAGQRCAETLRSRGYDGGVTMVCAEPELPYDRPPLSKGALRDASADQPLWFRAPAWYADNRVELLLGERATALDPSRRRLELSSGGSLAYDELLIATGAGARTLAQLEGFANAQALRTLADARRLRAQLMPGARLAIVGAGFIGQEVAATALAAGVEVTLIEALPLPLAGLLGERIGRWLTELHSAAGVRVLLSAQVSAARGGLRIEQLELADGRTIDCDAVVVGVGVAPQAEWLAGSGLDPAGVLTDTAGRTALPHVFAAGDVCRPFDPRCGRHVRTEHWDAAARQGAAAGSAMLGDDPRPPGLPSFWSDQHGIRIQYVGHADEADSLRIDGDPDDLDFSVLYSRRGRAVAALTVGRPRELIALRRLIEDDPDVREIRETETKEMMVG
jgi:NADPH-dependent 2,4-dienoyl-CoA reductase/sulfur reductase-like enzyme